MTTGMLRRFGLLAGLAGATACTDPVSCTADVKKALTVGVRAPGGGDITPTARIDVTRDGVVVPQGQVSYPATGAPASTPIGIYGFGGSYSITVHSASYRDTTVTATVLDDVCGPAQPPRALTVVLTAL